MRSEFFYLAGGMEMPFSHISKDHEDDLTEQYAQAGQPTKPESTAGSSLLAGATNSRLLEVPPALQLHGEAVLMDSHGSLPIPATCMASLSETQAVWLTSSTQSPAMNPHTSNQLIKASTDSRRGSTMTGISMVKALGSLGGSHDAGCMEQLLVHCLTAIENNDATSAQQLMWVLNNTVSTDGDPNQRVTAYFLRALMSRAARMAPNLATQLHTQDTITSKLLSGIELAGFVDLTPWHRFGFSAANGAIMEALENKQSVHIVDFSITHCMQWPTLIEALSKRQEGPPYVRLTVHSARPPVPPFLNMSLEEVGLKLNLFARSKKVPFHFSVIPQEISQLTPSSFDMCDDEMLVINCQMRARYIYEEPPGPQGVSARAQFMRLIRDLHPHMVTFVDEDANLVNKDIVSRLKAAFNYLWIPFDALDTFLPRGSKERMQQEADIGSKIENIIACEGQERVERPESKERWMQRLRNISNLQSIQFSEAVVAEVRSMLEEHAAGWGLKKDGDSLLLTWKGHNVVFATACVSM